MLGKTTQLMQQFDVHKVAFTKALLSQSKRSEKGLTLLECLVAIVVVTAVIAVITPPIMLTVATRVQNRKADQARQLAQAQVDQVKRLVEKGTYSTTELNKLAPQEVGGTGRICNVPISFKTSNPDQRVDINGDNINDFWVQTFRNEGVLDPNTSRPVAFDLGVRVYAYFEGQTPDQVKRSSLGFTTANGGQRNRPLVTLYNRVAISDTQTSLDSYKKITLDSGTNPECPQ